MLNRSAHYLCYRAAVILQWMFWVLIITFVLLSGVCCVSKKAPESTTNKEEVDGRQNKTYTSSYT